jgi:hypothetical protein
MNHARSRITQGWGFRGPSWEFPVLLSVLCCPCPQSLPTGQTSPSLPVRYPQRPLQFTFRLPSSSCILACWQVIFDDQTNTSPQKKIKSSLFFQQFVRFLSFFFSSVSYISQNEQILNRICTKESDSASSKVSLGKGPTPVIIHSAFSTFSISSSIHTRSPISFSSSQCTRSGHSHQRWC